VKGEPFFIFYEL